MTVSYNRSQTRIIPRELIPNPERVELGDFEAGSRADGRPGGPVVGSAEARAAFARALEQGYREGLASGQAAAAGEAAAIAARLEDAVKRLDALCTRVVAAVAPLDGATAESAVRLACTMARQIVRHELALRPDAILRVVDEARAALPAERRQVRVLVHPDDAALVSQHATGGDPEHGRWRVVADPSIVRGGCRIEASSGDVDATLATRWASLYAALGLDAAALARDTADADAEPLPATPASHGAAA